MPTPRPTPTALAGLFLLLAAPAFAAPADTPACRAACGAVAQSRLQNPVPVQACLIRCEAARRYQAELRRAPPPGPGRAAGWAQPVQAAALGRVAAPAALLQPASLGLPGQRWGAIYAVAPPAPQLGIALGEADRLAAHSQAAQRCNGARDIGCRMLVEFTDRCAAVAQGRRRKGIVLTSHPSTYEVSSISTGTGASLEAAEGEALAQCRARDGQAVCRVASSACAP